MYEVVNPISDLRTISFRRRAAWILVLAFQAGFSGRAQSFDADVVVLSDTSASMTENDPQNAVVLEVSAPLFADIVPGKLAAIRLTSIAGKRQSIPFRCGPMEGPHFVLPGPCRFRNLASCV